MRIRWRMWRSLLVTLLPWALPNSSKCGHAECQNREEDRQKRHTGPGAGAAVSSFYCADHDEGLWVNLKFWWRVWVRR